MYKCYDCDRTFEEPKVCEDLHPYQNDYASEKWYLCPHCGSGNFEFAKPCKICGEPLGEDDEVICAGCLDEIGHNYDFCEKFDKDFCDIDINIAGRFVDAFPNIKFIESLVEDMLNAYVREEHLSYADFIKDYIYDIGDKLDEL